jgi:hypothetical protein
MSIAVDSCGQGGFIQRSPQLLTNCIKIATYDIQQIWLGETKFGLKPSYQRRQPAGAVGFVLQIDHDCRAICPAIHSYSPLLCCPWRYSRNTQVVDVT